MKSIDEWEERNIKVKIIFLFVFFFILFILKECDKETKRKIYKTKNQTKTTNIYPGWNY